MAKFKLLIIVILSAFIWACADDNSSQSRSQKLEDALNSRDYDYIIHKLAYFSEEGSADPANWRLIPDQGLSAREIYLLQMACIGKTGFDIRDIITEFYEDESDAVSIILESLNPGETVNTAQLEVPRYWIAQDIDIADTMPNGDLDIEFAGGWGSALDVVLILAQISASLSPTPVSFDKNDPNYIGNIFKGMSDLEIENAVSGMVGPITDDINRLESVVNSLELREDDDGKVKEKLDEFTSSIKNPDGSIDEMSITNFINNKIVGN